MAGTSTNPNAGKISLTGSMIGLQVWPSAMSGSTQPVDLIPSGQISPVLNVQMSDGKTDMGPIDPTLASSGIVDGDGNLMYPTGVRPQGS